MEPESPPLNINDIPEVAITESSKLPKPTAPVVPSSPEKEASVEFIPLSTPLEIPQDADENEKKLAEQLRTFRESPPSPVDVRVTPTIPTFQYHQGAIKKPVSLEFQEYEDPESYICLKMVSVDKESDAKVDELYKLIRNKWGNSIQEPSIRRRGGFEGYFYFLKYSHLEKRDIDALEKLRKFSSRRCVCFIFVDEEFKHMHRVVRKLQERSLIPPGAIFLPWLDTFTDGQLKAIVGLMASAKFEDMTKSMRITNRVLIPPLLKPF